MSNLQSQIHALEQEFGLSAQEILDTINSRNRCKIAVRGAIAERHLTRYLRQLLDQGVISEFEDFDTDGHPDLRVRYSGRSFLLECKNVQKAAKASAPITVDFWRTRAPIGRSWERYYSPDEFQVLAACLWNRTGNWEYRFAATEDLPRHKEYPSRISNRVTVDVSPMMPDTAVWTPDLPSLLSRL